MDVHLEDNTVWLDQVQMKELFKKDVRIINEHIFNLFEEKELSSSSTVHRFWIVQKEGTRDVARNLSFYNLDVIISVRYRVKSKEGTQFRIWVTERLKEHLIRGVYDK